MLAQPHIVPILDVISPQLPGSANGGGGVAATETVVTDYSAGGNLDLIFNSRPVSLADRLSWLRQILAGESLV